MDKINVTTNNHSEMIDITRQLSDLIPKGFTSGICHIFCQHTTAGLTINENADPDVQRDLLYIFSVPRPTLKSYFYELMRFLKKVSENKKIRIFSTLNHIH